MKRYLLLFFTLCLTAHCVASGFKDWDAYFQDTLNANGPHKTTFLAQAYFKQEGKTWGSAADLGAGTGRDTLFLLEHGWNVFALDAQPLSIDIILDRASEHDCLETSVAPFAEK